MVDRIWRLAFAVAILFGCSLVAAIIGFLIGNGMPSLGAFAGAESGGFIGFIIGVVLAMKYLKRNQG